MPRIPATSANQFTSQEQVAGYKWLQMADPAMAARPAHDPDLLEAFIDACENVICLDLVDTLCPNHRRN